MRPRILARFGCRLAAVLLAAVAPTTARAEPAAVQPATYAAPAPDAEAQHEATAKQVRLVKQLIATRRTDPTLPAQLVQLTADLPAADGVACFEHLAEMHAQAGDYNAAADVRRSLVDRWPDQPAALAATRWLIALYGSSEVAWAKRTKRVVPRGLKPVEDPQASPPEASTEFAQYAVLAGDLAVQKHPSWNDDPPLLMARSAAARRVRGGDAALARLRRLRGLPPGDPWGDAARMESWLQELRSEAPPKGLVACPLTGAPVLDGQLADDCWQSAARIALTPGGTNPSPTTARSAPATEVLLARDAEYLYLAVRAAKAVPQAPVVQMQGVDGRRDYDTAERRGDHVQVRLDLDRDYATWFEWVIDARGHTADSAWTDAAWNPEWFVAASDDAQQWRAEAAIPWTSLGAAAPATGEAWAVAVERRIRPGAKPLAAFTAANDPPTPAAFGILRFQ